MVRDLDYVTRMYFREMVETPLLTPAEEVELADRISQGDAAARERMICANLRLVVKIATGFAGLGQLELADLINEGNLGLMRAVERFDPRKGAKLSTYAAWWINQAMRRALANQGRTIRLPVHVHSMLYKVRRVAARLAAETGKPPTAAEVAAETGLKESRCEQLLNLECDVTVSYDAEAEGDGGGEMKGIHAVREKLADELAVNPAAEVESHGRHALLLELLEELPDREQQILRRRFGLDGLDPETLEVVGERFGVTRERIRQIEAMALEKLRVRMERNERTPDEAVPAPRGKSRKRRLESQSHEPGERHRVAEEFHPNGVVPYPTTEAGRAAWLAEMKVLRDHGWSLKDLGKRFDLHPSTVCKILSKARKEGV